MTDASLVYETTFEGLPLRSGDILCTTDGVADNVVGQLWRALGHLVPGEIDHVLLYVGPGGRCVEAGARGVIAFEMPGGHWDATLVAEERWLLDTLVGIAYPLAGRDLAPDAEAQIRAAVANYCLEQASFAKPYNYNIFNPATDSAFYCSQLIYRAYLECGIDLVNGEDLISVVGAPPLVLPQVLWQNLPRRRAITPADAADAIGQ